MQIGRNFILKKCILKEHFLKEGLSLEGQELCLNRLNVVQGEEFVKVSRGKVVEAFSQVELAMIKMKPLLEEIRISTHEKERRIEELALEIRACLVRKDKLQAKFSLKRKKRLESQLEKQMQIYLNLEELKDSLSSKIEEKDVLSCYEEGLKALKTNLLIKEEVDDVVDDLKETLSEANEIGNALAMNENDEDLEEELEQMAKEEELLEELANLDVENSDLERKKSRIRCDDKQTVYL